MPYEKVGKNEPVCIADEVPFEIPESWEWVRISSIGSIVRGSGIKRTETIEAGKPCVRYGELYTTYHTSFNQAVSFVSEDLFKRCKHFSYGDILMPLTGENKPDIAKAVAYLGNDLIAAGGDLAYWTAHGMNPLYLTYLMASPYIVRRKVNLATGDIIVHISGDKLGTILIPIPPLSEQQRIVDKILEAEVKVAEYTGKENLLNVLQKNFPDALKKSILQRAVQGKLVPQDPNDEPASVLLERIRAEKQKLIAEGKIKKDKHESIIFRRDNSHYEKLDGIERCIDNEIPFEIPESWEWVRFYNIASFQNGDRSKNYPNRNEYVSNGVAWINTGHITSDGFLNVNTMNYITEEKYSSLSNGRIQKGDLVYCLRGATFGKVARIEPFSKGAIASSLMIIRPFDVSLRNYIYWYLRSPSAYIELHKYSNGSAQPNLAAKDVGKYLVPIPPLDEQIRIINKSIRLLAIIENI